MDKATPKLADNGRKMWATVVSTCDNCGQRIETFIDLNNGQLFEWTHPLSGEMNCEVKFGNSFIDQELNRERTWMK